MDGTSNAERGTPMVPIQKSTLQFPASEPTLTTPGHPSSSGGYTTIQY